MVQNLTCVAGTALSGNVRVGRDQRLRFYVHYLEHQRYNNGLIKYRMYNRGHIKEGRAGKGEGIFLRSVLAITMAARTIQIGTV